MKRVKMLALGAATVALLAVGTACSDPAGTEDWWDEEDQAEFISEYQGSQAGEQTTTENTVQPKRKKEVREKEIVQ